MQVVGGGGGEVPKWCPSLVTPWTVAHRAPLSMEFPRQEYWSGLPFPTPVDLPIQWSNPPSLVFPALAGEFFATTPPENPLLFPAVQQWGVSEAILLNFGGHPFAPQITPSSQGTGEVPRAWLQTIQHHWCCLKMSPPCPGALRDSSPEVKLAQLWVQVQEMPIKCAKEVGEAGGCSGSRWGQPLAQLLASLQGKHVGSPGGHGKSWPGTTQFGLTTLSSHKCDHACLGLDNPGQEGAPQVSQANGGADVLLHGWKKTRDAGHSPGHWDHH